MSETLEIMRQHISNIYPNANTVDKLCNGRSKNRMNRIAKQIDQLTKDDNNFILIDNTQPDMLKTIVAMYFKLKGQPFRFKDKDFTLSAFCLIRSSNLAMFPISGVDDDDFIIDSLRSAFRPKVTDCVICFHKFRHNETRQRCCNCHAPLCGTCCLSYLGHGNNGWCPICRRHIAFYELKEWIHRVKK